MSRLGSPSPVSSLGDSAISQISTPGAQSPAVLEFDPKTHKKILQFDMVSRTWNDSIIPLKDKPPLQIPAQLESINDIMQRITDETFSGAKNIGYFFALNDHLNAFIKNLTKIIDTFYIHFFNLIRDQALLIAGSQLLEKSFNAKKDLDLQWMLELSNTTDLSQLKSSLKETINSLTHCSEYYEGDSWILFKIRWPHEIDLKISFSTDNIPTQTIRSLIDRRIAPEMLHDITNKKLIYYKNKDLRFVRKNPTFEDYAYVLSKLALNRKQYPAISTEIIAQLTTAITKKDPTIEKEFWHLLSKKLPGSIPEFTPESWGNPIPAGIQQMINHYMDDIKTYLATYVHPSSHASNPQGLFTSLSSAQTATPATPKGFSYAAAAKKA